ncbi:MAG TPA: A/G-specific adenine glycosylase [Bryobacteraceae bacterium]|nr:A/G-specific adenine glycosylase [Bryobacteraceae bacterium]
MKAIAEPQVLKAAKAHGFSRCLLAWYDQHARRLPWREDRDPYRVWVSEIMLQQTRVAAVLEHYRRFLKKFPTVRKLAAARESSVLAAWSGLGYYRRARMLHAAAKRVVKRYQAEFPPNSEGLRQLPGIGRYTAAAIASIAYDEPVAAVDGNVERVLERMSGKRLTGEQTWNTANHLLDPARSGDFNQAMMELGATICLPRQPQCLLCPVSEFCAARGELEAKEARPQQRKRKIFFGLARRSGHVLLVQRDKKESLMPGMWELPQLRSRASAKRLLSLRHSITVTDYQVDVMEVSTRDEGSGRWIARARLASLPLTGLARKILQRAELL